SSRLSSTDLGEAGLLSVAAARDGGAAGRGPSLSLDSLPAAAGAAGAGEGGAGRADGSTLGADFAPASVARSPLGRIGLRSAASSLPGPVRAGRAAAAVPPDRPRWPPDVAVAAAARRASRRRPQRDAAGAAPAPLPVFPRAVPALPEAGRERRAPAPPALRAR